MVEKKTPTRAAAVASGGSNKPIMAWCNIMTQRRCYTVSAVLSEVFSHFFFVFLAKKRKDFKGGPQIDSPNIPKIFKG